MFKTYSIDFASPRREGWRVSWPLSTVFSTKTGSIEAAVDERWGDIVSVGRPLSFQELKRHRDMERYVAARLAGAELKWVAGNAYDGSWMSPLERFKGGFRVEPNSIERVGCSRWENSSIYLELSCRVGVDVMATLVEYAAAGWLSFEFKTTLVTRECVVRFNRDLPLLLRYSSSPMAYALVLEAFSRLASKRDNSVGFRFAKHWNVKDPSKYGFSSEWLGDGSLLCRTTSAAKLLFDSAKANPVKTAAAAAVAGVVLSKVPLGRKRKIVK